MQKRQREAGKTFVSRTSLAPAKYGGEIITVFRVVLANPLTSEEILETVIAEQLSILQQGEPAELLAELQSLIAS